MKVVKRILLVLTVVAMLVMSTSVPALAQEIDAVAGGGTINSDTESGATA